MVERVVVQVVPLVTVRAIVRVVSLAAEPVAAQEVPPEVEPGDLSVLVETAA